MLRVLIASVFAFAVGCAKSAAPPSPPDGGAAYISGGYTAFNASAFGFGNPATFLVYIAETRTTCPHFPGPAAPMTMTIVGAAPYTIGGVTPFKKVPYRTPHPPGTATAFTTIFPPDGGRPLGYEATSGFVRITRADATGGVAGSFAGSFESIDSPGDTISLAGTFDAPLPCREPILVY